MRHDSLRTYLAREARALAAKPSAWVFAEDGVELASGTAHLLAQGFGRVSVLASHRLVWPDGVDPRVVRVDHDLRAPHALSGAVNQVIAALPGAWLHYCYNGEYLFYPFCETRTIGDFTTFLAEERRASAISYVIDLYATDLDRHPTAVSREEAALDTLGYYALGRSDRAGGLCERQMDFFGGLRWRFEEHVPADRRRIDRVSVFRAEAGLELREDHTFNRAEFNTYACPWHHSATTAICSFRTAKALRRNPGSREAIHSFAWRNSQPFRWSSAQLMDLGLMEPGQWF